MAQAIGQVLALGVGVALSPIPIVAVVLMLGTARGRANGPAFVLGWIGGLAAVGAIVLFVFGGADASEQGQPADWVDVVRIVAGVLLLRIAFREWRKRPHGDEQPELPSWMRTLDRFTAIRSATIGAVLSGVNPKNLLLTIGAASAIAQTGISAGRQAVALAVYIAVATLGVGLPVLAYFALGERSRHALEELKGWMAGNNATIVAVICVVIAAKLIGDGISGF